MKHIIIIIPLLLLTSIYVQAHKKKHHHIPPTGKNLCLHDVQQIKQQIKKYDSAASGRPGCRDHYTSITEINSKIDYDSSKNQCKTNCKDSLDQVFWVTWQAGSWGKTLVCDFKQK
ncbi:MAG: hypothetical protein OXD32_09170 [Endozoicomonadaceae bacterium]|nr:hypothetical protein [Endozoicomonadaceae bacterium]MCY4178643.1 hypothetical protein [Endozoicomonadaceae bacterium]